MTNFGKKARFMYNFVQRELIKDKYETLESRIEGNFVGDKKSLSQETFIKGDLTLKENSRIGPRSILIGKIQIGKNSYISPCSIIVGNINIGDNVIVFPGSVVLDDIPSNSVAHGNPAKVEKGVEKNKKIYEEITITEIYPRRKKKIHDFFGKLVVMEKNVKVGQQVYIEGGGDITIGGGSEIGDRCLFACSHHMYDQKHEFLKSEERWESISIGRNVKIGAGSFIRGRVEVGNNVVIKPGSIVVKDVPSGVTVGGCPAAPSSTKATGDTVMFPEIGNLFAVTGHMFAPVSYFNEYSNINIGYTTLLNKEMMVIGQKKLTIGEGSMIAPRVTFITEYPLGSGDIWLGKHVWIGAGAVVLPNVKINDGAIIGAGAVVDKNVNKNEIWVGNPLNRRLSTRNVEK